MTLNKKNALGSASIALGVMALAGCLLYFQGGTSLPTTREVGTSLAMMPWSAGATLCVAVALTALLHQLLFRCIVHSRVQLLASAVSATAQDPATEVPIFDSSSDELAITARAFKLLAANHREAVASLEHSREAAQERQALRDDIKAMNSLMAVVGHELRTPLAALRAMSKCIIQEDVHQNSEEARTFLQAIHDETVRMAHLVSNLLEAARLDSGYAKWNWGTWSLSDAIRDALTVIRPLIDKNQVRLQSNCGSEEIMMNGDREAITRLLINLLSNSAKHTTSGAIEVSARGSRDIYGQMVELTVRDTGAGIPSPVLSKLGCAFATNEGTVSANFARGSGLGLSICRVISSVHGGEISVVSQPGSGSTFTARLRADLNAPVEQEVDVVHVRGEAA